MTNVFFATIQPLLSLFVCILIGYVLAKKKILPLEASSVLAKLQTWVFFPALCFISVSQYFTVDTLSNNAVNFIFGAVSVGIALIITYSIVRLFVPNKCFEQNVYKYALTFANSGYVGDPMVLALYGDAVLSYYKIFTLPVVLVIYTWGMRILGPQNGTKRNPFRSLLNPPTIALFLGVIFGLAGLCAEGSFISTKMPFVLSTLNTLKTFVGPLAMLTAGITIAKYDFSAMLKKGKVYWATFLRLLVIPAVLIGALYAVQMLFVHVLHIAVSNCVLYLAFFAYAAPLGLNTVVFPEAHGNDPSTGASMATISHTFCVISIPLLFTLMTLLFGAPVW